MRLGNACIELEMLHEETLVAIKDIVTVIAAYEKRLAELDGERKKIVTVLAKRGQLVS